MKLLMLVLLWAMPVEAAIVTTEFVYEEPTDEKQDLDVLVRFTGNGPITLGDIRGRTISRDDGAFATIANHYNGLSGYTYNYLWVDYLRSTYPPVYPSDGSPLPDNSQVVSEDGVFSGPFARLEFQENVARTHTPEPSTLFLLPMGLLGLLRRGRTSECSRLS